MTKTFAQLSAEMQAVQTEVVKLIGRVEAMYSHGRTPDLFDAALRTAGMTEGQIGEYGSALRSYFRSLDDELTSASKTLGALAHIVSAADHKARRGNSGSLALESR
jgi:hypothetical protein